MNANIDSSWQFEPPHKKNILRHYISFFLAYNNWNENIGSIINYSSVVKTNSRTRGNGDF